MKVFISILSSQLLTDWLALKRSSTWILPSWLIFTALLAIPMTLAGDDRTLIPVATMLIWIIASLTLLLSLEHMFSDDIEQGIVQLALVSPSQQTILSLVLAKILTRWWLIGTSISILCCLGLWMFGVEISSFVQVFFSIWLGMLALTCLAAFGSCLSSLSKEPGMLVAIICMPLALPILILGQAACLEISALVYIGILAGLFLIIAPWISIAVLKLQTE